MPLSAQQRDAAASVNLLITLAGMAASVALVFTFPDIVGIVRDDPVKAAAFLLLTLALQLFTVEIYGRGSIGVSVIGLLAASFSLGPGPAMAIAFIAALAQ